MVSSMGERPCTPLANTDGCHDGVDDDREACLPWVALCVVTVRCNVNGCMCVRFVSETSKLSVVTPLTATL